MRVLVIGLDGACLDLLEWLDDSDSVPTLSTLRADSAVGPLESQLPPWTPSAWPSMYTGVNPGKHGVYDFLRFEGYDWDIVNRSHVKAHAVWELLSMHGYSSVVLNVPVTHPPREFDGVLVPGYTAPEDPECHPEGVWEELDRALDGYSLYADTLGSRTSDAKLANDLLSLVRMRGDAFRYLVDENDPDFGFVQFQSPDTVFHQLPHDETAIRRVYSAVDEEVSEIVETCDAEVTFVVSDHGMGRMGGCEFRVNDYLRENGYVVATTDGSGMPSWKAEAREASPGQGERTALELGTTWLIDACADVGLTSQRIGAALRAVGLEEWVLDTLPMDLVRRGTEQVDFAASTAFMRSRTEMGIRLNLAEREPAGVVERADYDRVRNELIEALRRVRTPAGEPVFEAVQRREEVFDGPYLEDAPDIVTVPDRFDHFLVANLKGAAFGDPTEPWEHKRDGMVMVEGDGVDPHTEFDGAHLFDVTPTILACFGLPIGNRMDGTPLPLFGPTGRTAYPTFEASPQGTVDTGAVEERLADLGYLK